MSNELVVNPWFLLVQDQLQKGTSVQDLREMMDLAERHRKDLAEQAWNRSMMNCQREMPALVRSGHNTHKNLRYAKFETLDKQIRHIYLRENFSLCFTELEQTNPEVCRMALDIMHVDGHVRRFVKDVHVDGVGQKGNASMTPTQADGSTSSYARRYVTKMAFNLVEAGEDLDGDVANLGKISEEECKLLRRTISETSFLTGVAVDLKALMRFASPDLKTFEDMNREQYLRVMTDLGFRRHEAVTKERKGK